MDSDNSKEYQRITKILVWIVSLSMISYFVISPLSFFRSNPPRTSPGNEETSPSIDENISTNNSLQNQTQTDFPESIPDDLLPDEDNENIFQENNGTSSRF